CFDHLLTANGLVLHAARDAIRRDARTIWERMPVVPRLVGRALIRSQSPHVKRAYIAPAKATPSASDIPVDVVQRFVAHTREAVEWMETLNEAAAARVIMTSPFLRFVTYSVLDACRLIAGHDRRHVEQARRVIDGRR